MVNTNSYTANDAGKLESVNDSVSADLSSYDSSCLANPTNCVDGFSIAFWFNGWFLFLPLRNSFVLPSNVLRITTSLSMILKMFLVCHL